MKVSELKTALQNIPDDALVVFQGNVKGYDADDGELASYTTCTGNCFEVWHRENGNELVLDCEITDSES